jgi:Fe-S cluster biosynthesis and repair protein YggX
MCQFISWKEYEGKNYFLINEDLETKEGKKLLKEDVKDDLCGHGALTSYYPELVYKGTSHECSDFSSPYNFPKEIVKAIKQGKLSRIGICVEVLNVLGVKEYNKIKQPALAEYNKIEQSAWAEYNKIEQPALAEYNKIKQPALAEYNKIEQSAWAEYNKIKQPALAEYNKIKQSALAEYNKIEQNTFSKIVKQKKYRKDNWK